MMYNFHQQKKSHANAIFMSRHRLIVYSGNQHNIEWAIKLIDEEERNK